MNFNLRIVSLSILFVSFLFFSLNLGHAACFIDGSVNSSSTPTNPDYNVYALCVNASEFNADNVGISPGTTSYFVNFGSPTDSCQGYCDTVILFANSTSGDANATIILNSSNIPSWNLASDGMTNIIHYNITMQPLPPTATPQFSSNSLGSSGSYHAAPRNATVDISPGAGSVNEVIFSSNATGTWQNKSLSGGDVSNPAGDTFLLQLLSLSAGSSFSYYWFANNTLGAANWTQTYTFLVTQATPELTSSLTSSIVYGSASDYQASASNEGDGDCTYSLLRNGDLIADGNSVNDASILGAGSYIYNYTSSGGQNYTSFSRTDILEVNRTAPAITALLNDAPGNLSGTEPYTVNVTGSTSGGTLAIFLNFTSITNGDNFTLSAGAYTFLFNVTGDQNYTDAFEVLSVNVSSAPDTTAPILYIDSPAQNGYYNGSSYVLINFSASDEVSISSLWFFNGTQNLSYTLPLMLNLSNGAYTFIFYANDTSNNLNSSLVSFSVNYTIPDTFAPQFTSSFAPQTILDNQSFSFQVSATDPSGLGGFSVNDTRFRINATGFLYNSSTLANITYLLNITINDTLGNMNSSIFTLVVNSSFIPDIFAPVINFNAPTPLNGSIFVVNSILVNSFTSATDTDFRNYTYSLFNTTGLVKSFSRIWDHSVLVSAGYFTCALKQNGSVQCWGDNSYGQSRGYSGTDVLGLTGGHDFSCALKQNGSIQCWGDNSYGQSANYTGNDAIAVSAGSVHTCALKQNGSIQCWGGVGYDSGQMQPYNGNDAIAISTGDAHTCALKQNGSIQCWGDNSYGQSANYNGKDAVAITAGEGHTCALKQNGSVQCWGDNSAGQATNYNRNDAVAISAGGYHTCALKQNGSVQCWGDNSAGQAITYNGNDSIAISAGSFHTCVLKQNGSLQCWGDDTNGQSPTYNGNDLKKTSFYVFTGLSRGDYFLSATACDILGNCNTSETRTITLNLTVLDSNPPQFTSSFAPQIILDNQSFSFQVSATDPSGIGGFSVNDTRFRINATGFLYNSSALTNVTYRLNITVNDTVGNKNSSILILMVNSSFIPDTIPPIFSNLATQNIYTNQSLTFQVTATDPSGIGCFTVNDTTRFSINCSGFLQNKTTFLPGAFYLNITVNDTVGNRNSSILLVNVTIVPYLYPLTNFTNPISPVTYLSARNYTFNVTWSFPSGSGPVLSYLNLSGQLYAMTNFGSGRYGYAIGDLNAANYTYFFSAVTAQNYTNSTSPQTYVINPATPIITAQLNGQANNLSGFAPYFVNATGFTTGGSLQIFRDSLALTNGENDSLSQGFYTYLFNVTGNQNYTNAAVIFSVNVSTAPDIIAPNLFISSPLQNGVYNNSSYVLINFSASDETNLSSLWFFNSTDNVSYTTPEILNLSNGAYTFIFYANDTSGNVNSSNISFVVNFTAPDTFPPQFTSSFASQTILDNQSFSFQVSATDPSGIGGFSVNNTRFKINATGFLYNSSALTNVTYRLNITVNDTVGNKNSSIFTLIVNTSYIPDTIPPVLTVISPLEGGYYNSTSLILVNFSATDNILVSSRWYFNGTRNVTYSTPVIVNLSNGAYTFYFYANDTTHNVNFTTRSFVVNYTAPDTAAPQFTSSFAPVNIFDNSSFGFQLNAVDPSGIGSFSVNDTRFTINSTNFLWNSSSLIDATYLLNITVNDTVGNMNSSIFTLIVNSSDLNRSVTILFVSPTPVNGTIVSNTSISVNTLTSTGYTYFKNFSYSLYNLSGPVSSFSSTLEDTVFTAGKTHTCVLKQNGNVQCWGDNSHGQAANYTGNDAVAVSGGQYNTCALKQNGSVQCWGDNSFGQSTGYLGTDAIAIATGNMQSCALIRNGNVQCWGWNNYGQAANYSGRDAIAIRTGGDNTCVLKQNGNVQCWGDNSFGQSTGYLGTDAVSLTLGDGTTCVVTRNQSVQCWGYNVHGTSTNYNGYDALAVSAGADHACVLKQNGNVQCWGWNNNNQALNYTGSDAIAIATGGDHSCVLKQNGNVQCWGENTANQSVNYTGRDIKLTPMFTFTSLADGIYYLNASVCDTSGACNITETRQIIINKIIDTVPPQFTSSFAPQTIAQNQSFSFQVTATDSSGIGGFGVNDTRFSINSTGFLWNSSSLANVNYLLNITVNDTLGNMNSSIFTLIVNTSYIPDTTLPVLTVTSPLAGGYYNLSSFVLVNFSATDNVGVSSLWFFNGTQNISYTSPVSVTLANGNFSFVFYANDTSGNVNFTTRNFSVNVISHPNPAAVDLGTASSFAILAETLVSDANPSVSLITGNVGMHPAAGTFITDVSCTKVRGNIYDNNAGYTGGYDSNVSCRLTNGSLLGIAIGDMTAAESDAAGRAPDATELYSGDLSGKTLASGVYKWSTAVNINSGLTLSGNSSDVWIFEIAGNLNLASGVNVTLTGGAQASNIFWQVGGLTGATLGTYSTFNGNILSEKQIIIQSGAILSGRALAQTQVTLDGNIVTMANYSASDTTPPVLTVTSPLAGGYYNTSTLVLINFTASDNVGVASLWFFNGTSNASYSVPLTLNLSNGNYNFIFYANDTSGNVNFTTRSFVVNYTSPDTAAPQFTSSFAPVNIFDNQSFSFQVTATDPSGLGGFSVNDSRFTINSTGFLRNSSIITNLTYFLNISVSDTFGNTNRSIFTLIVTTSRVPDTAAPVFTNLATQNIFENQSLSYALTATDPSGIGCFSVNDTRFNINCSGFLKNITTLLPGRYYMNLTVNDTVGNTNSTSLLVNVTAIPLSCAEFVSGSVSPTYYINRSGVYLNFTAIFNNARATWVNITDPLGGQRIFNVTNGSVLFNSLGLIGHYNLTFYANGSCGSVISSPLFFFESLKPFIFDANVINNTLSGINVSWILTYSNNTLTGNLSQNGTIVDLFADVLSDLEFDAYSGHFRVILHGINVTTETNKVFGVDLLSSPAPGYLKTYGISNPYNFTSGATVIFYYDDTSYSTESLLELHKCDSWNFSGQSCLGTWYKVNAVQNTTGHYFTYLTSNFSGFSLYQGTPSPSGGGGGGGGSSASSSGGGGGVGNAATNLVGAGPLSISLRPESSALPNSKNLAVYIVLNNLDNLLTPIETNLTYRILNMQGNEVYRNQDVFTVFKSQSFTKHFNDFDAGSGNYTLIVTITYNGTSQDRSVNFTVSAPREVNPQLPAPSPPTVNLSEGPSIFLWGILLLVLFVIVLLIVVSSRHKDRLQLRSIPGKKVYTDSGEYFGIAKDVFLEDNKIHGVTITLSKPLSKKYHAKVILLRYSAVINIGETVMVRSRITDAMQEKAPRS